MPEQSPEQNDAAAPAASEGVADPGAALARTTARQPSPIERPSTEIPEYLEQIRFRLELRVALQRFTLRDLQRLTPGSILQTEHSSARDLVLTAAKERLLLVELEAVELQLAARVKRLL